MRDMGEIPEKEGDPALPRDLRFLKALVTVLTVVMIAGVITIMGLLVIRLNDGGAPVTIAPGDFAVPESVGIVGISVVADRTVIVGDDRVIRVYDSTTRTLVDEIALDR